MVRDDGRRACAWRSHPGAATSASRRSRPQTSSCASGSSSHTCPLVDLFIAPSAFLAQTYVDWGIPPTRSWSRSTGARRLPGSAVTEEREHRDRFGFFGQLTPTRVFRSCSRRWRAPGRGVEQPDDSLLAHSNGGRHRAEAEDARRLARPHAWIHGANLDLQPGTFQNRIERTARRHARQRDVRRAATTTTELASLMSNVDWVVVPSIWWENSPLVIQEAFHSGARSSAATSAGWPRRWTTASTVSISGRAIPRASRARSRAAAEEPGLWEKLRDGIRPMYAMDEHVATLTDLYQGLLTRKETVRAG